MLHHLSTSCSTAIEEVCCMVMFVLLFLTIAVVVLFKYCQSQRGSSPRMILNCGKYECIIN